MSRYKQEFDWSLEFSLTQSWQQQTTNFETSFPIFNKKRYDITWESSASRRFSWNILPYLLFLKKRQNFLLSSAAKYRWRFKGLRFKILLYVWSLWSLLSTSAKSFWILITSFMRTFLCFPSQQQATLTSSHVFVGSE